MFASQRCRATDQKVGHFAAVDFILLRLHLGATVGRRPPELSMATELFDGFLSFFIVICRAK